MGAKKEVWQAEKRWIGAEGVAAKFQREIDRRAGLAKRAPKSLTEFLLHPSWRGSDVQEVGEFFVIRHPSGARARLNAADLDDTEVIVVDESMILGIAA